MHRRRTVGAWVMPWVIRPAAVWILRALTSLCTPEFGLEFDSSHSPVEGHRSPFARSRFPSENRAITSSIAANIALLPLIQTYRPIITNIYTHYQTYRPIITHRSAQTSRNLLGKRLPRLRFPRYFSRRLAHFRRCGRRMFLHICALLQGGQFLLNFELHTRVRQSNFRLID